MKDKVVFISGANRGIGLELTSQMSKKGYKVVAGYRDKKRSKSLLKTNGIFPFKVDVTAEADLRKLYEFISKRFGYLDILINNAGVNVKPSVNINELEWDDIVENFTVNVGGPFLVTKYLYSLITKGKEKKIINISSRMGSIQLCSGGAVPYRISKTALNMLVKNQAIEFQPDGVTVAGLHPGWVKTDMGGRDATLEVGESAGKIIQTIEKISFGDTGKFMTFDGELIPY